MSTQPSADAITSEWEEQRPGLATLATLASPQSQPEPLFRAITEPADYPLEALGPTLEGAARAIHERIQAPQAICGQSVLGVAGLAAQQVADIQLPMGLTRPLSLFLVTVAASGERKSSADGLALSPIRAHEAHLRSDFVNGNQQYENSVTAWEKQRQDELRNAKSLQQKQQALSALGSPPQKPLVHLMTCPEPTYEGLVRLFVEGQPGLGLFSAEGGQFLGGHGMSKDHRLKTVAALNSLWDGESIRRVRAGDGIAELPGRRLSLHLLAQPQAASTLLADSVLEDVGLLSRLLVSAPLSASGGRQWREPTPAIAEGLLRYEKSIGNMLRRPLPLADGARNELQPRVVALCPAAREIWIKYANRVELEIGEGGKLAPIRAFANKLPEHASRLAAITALVEHPDTGVISETDLARGIDLASFYESEALRLHETGATDSTLLLAQRVLDWLQDLSSKLISLPDLYQKGPRPVRDKNTAEKIVGILEDHGWLVRVEGEAEIGGVRRKEVWRVQE